MDSHLSFLRNRPLDHVCRYVRLYKVGGLKVANPAEEVERPISHGDKSIGAKEEFLGPVCWLGKFSEYYSSHASLGSWNLYIL